MNNNFFKAYITIVILLLSFHMAAQQKLSYPQVNIKTYNQYLAGNWKDLINTGKEYLLYGEDFYYLQVRMGIAFYELKKYRKAVYYLQKAYRANRTNDLVNEYLYYAYLFSGRPMDAQKISNKFSVSLKQKIGLDYEPIIKSISYDMRFENSDDYFIGTSQGLLEQDVRGSFSYFDFGLEHIFGSSKLFWTYGKIKRQSNIYYIDETNSQTQDVRDVAQNQFYVNYAHQIDYGFNLSFAFSLINIVSTGSEMLPTFGRWGSTMSREVTTRYVSNEIVAFGALHKDIHNFKYGLNVSISNLDKSFQFQPGVQLIYYPFSNTNLYLSTTLDYKLDNASDNAIVFKPDIGVKLLGVYFETSYTFGDIVRFTESAANIVYNDDDMISNRFEFLSYTYLFKGSLNLFIKYQNYTKTNYYQLNGIEKEINYQTKSYTGGIKWNF